VQPLLQWKGNKCYICLVWGPGSRSGYGTALLVRRSRDWFLVVSLGIFSVATNRTMCPGVDSASKSEYEEFLLG
jgi:hypothetical protein